jgi:hypothetical protein
MKVASVVIALAMAGAPALAAQGMREYSVSRQRHGESRLQANLEFAAGTLRLIPGAKEVLYLMQVEYDPDRFLPESRYDASTGALRLGLSNSGRAGLRVSSRSQLAQVASIALSPAVALALDARLGAVDADLELGGLQLTTLNLTAGASRTSIRFSQPNRIRCSRMTVEAGATELRLEHLGNSRCEQVSVSGGIGQAVLDLGGAWGEGSTLAITLTAARLTLRIPRSLGVRVRSERFLSSFPSAGWTRSAGALLSPGYASARQHLDLNLDTAIGNVSVDWLP